MSEENNNEGKTVSKFRAGLSRIKEGAKRVGSEAKEQVTNPESTTRKVAHGVKASGQAIAGEVNKAANNKYVQQVSANSVKMVKGEDDGLLNIHREQKQRADNSHMDSLFSSGGLGAGFTITGSSGKHPQRSSLGGGFSIMGENHSKQQHSKHRGKGRTTLVVTKTVYRKQGRQKKRKTQQPDWTLF